MNALLLSCLLLAATLPAWSQQRIVLENPSFEGETGPGAVPPGWYNCAPSGLVPAVQPGRFTVSLTPDEGNSYISLAVHDTEQFEGVAQRLQTPLEMGEYYQLRMALAQSPTMVVRSPERNGRKHYSTPVKLIVWGSNGLCDKKEVLYETPLIDHQDQWRDYVLLLAPKKGSYSHLLFEAYYQTPVREFYNGHLLMDNLSDIVRLAEKPDVIRLENPSFEGMPYSGFVPAGWFSSGFAGESPPDVQPGNFQVSTGAYEGRTYAGLVVRDNDTWEALGQELARPMKAGSTYGFTLFLARSEVYLSQSRLTLQTAQYDAPVRLIIWGANEDKQRGEMLAQTPLITHTDWQRYNFELTPTIADWDQLIFEAYYMVNKESPYNGNLLIDHCSDLVEKRE